MRTLIHNYWGAFGGIGADRIAAESLGLHCVGSCEIATDAIRVYLANFGEVPMGDIRRISAERVPNHDLLLATPPCQDFSLAGHLRGISGDNGALIFEVVRIAAFRQATALIIENVPNLLKINGGHDRQKIRESLEAIGYRVFHRVLNAAAFGLPTYRARLMVVCLHERLGVDHFDWPSPAPLQMRLADVLLADHETDHLIIERDDITLDLAEDSRAARVAFPQKPIRIGHIRNGRSQGQLIYSIHGPAPSLTHAGGKTGLFLVNGKVRKLHPRECALVFGFPDSFRLPGSITSLQSLFGNSAAVPLLRAVIQRVVDTVNEVS